MCLCDDDNSNHCDECTKALVGATTRMRKTVEVGGLIQANGSLWRVREVSRTSDGFLMAMGQLVDSDGEPVDDEDGFPVFHSLFLGRA